MADYGNKNDRELTSQEAMNRILKDGIPIGDGAKEATLENILNEINLIHEQVSNISLKTQYEGMGIETTLNSGDSQESYFGTGTLQNSGITRQDGQIKDIRAEVVLRNIQSGNFYKIRLQIYEWNDLEGDYVLVREGLLTYTEDSGGGFSNASVDGLPAVMLKCGGLNAHWQEEGANHLPKIKVTNEGDDADISVSARFDTAKLEVVS